MTTTGSACHIGRCKLNLTTRTDLHWSNRLSDGADTRSAHGIVLSYARRMEQRDDSVAAPEIVGKLWSIDKKNAGPAAVSGIIERSAHTRIELDDGSWFEVTLPPSVHLVLRMGDVIELRCTRHAGGFHPSYQVELRRGEELLFALCSDARGAALPGWQLTPVFITGDRGGLEQALLDAQGVARPGMAKKLAAGIQVQREDVVGLLSCLEWRWLQCGGERWLVCGSAEKWSAGDMVPDAGDWATLVLVRQ